MQILTRNSLTSIINERGAAAVEFALVLPALLLLLLGIIQFGLIFFDYISITHAAREGARWAALESTDAEVRDKVKRSAPGLTINDADITIDPAGDRSGYIGEQVSVSIDHGTTIIAPFIGDALGIAGSEILLSSASAQRIE